MINLGRMYQIKAALSRGALKIGSRPKMLYPVQFRWRKGRIVIGQRLSSRSGVVIDVQDGHIQIGDHVSLNDHAVLLGHGGLTIGNDVRIAAHVVIASFDHNFDDVDKLIRMQGITKKPITIGDDVWIGAGAKILGGSHIAEGCVIGANAVVKGPTVPFGVYVGNPARLIKMRGVALLQQPRRTASDKLETARRTGSAPKALLPKPAA